MHKFLTNLFSLLLLALCSCEHESLILKDSEPILTFQFPNQSIELQSNYSDTSFTPIIEGTPPYQFYLKKNPLGGKLNIKNTGLVKLFSGAEPGIYQIDIKIVNTLKETIIEDALIIAINAPLVSYTRDILPLIEENCSPCHTSGGSQINLTDYLVTKNMENEILRRIQLDETDFEHMPLGGPKLSDERITKIQDWISLGSPQ